MRLYIQGLLRRKRFYAILLAATLLAFFYDMTEMRLSDATLERVLSENPFHYPAKVSYFEGGERPLRYLEIGRSSLPLIVFIHGAPSSLSFWKGMLKDSVLLSQAKLLAVDRPGYGHSGYGQPEISVKKQAALIARLIRKFREKHASIILHGSSYGGTVAARLAMDFPDLIDGVLLQSASLMPGEEKTYWISYPTHHWALRWLVPGSLRVANAEKLSHRDQLEAMAPFWECIRSATIILHGTADNLIYPQNACYAEERLTNAAFLESFMVEDRGHDLLWTGRDLLIRSLSKLVQRTSGH